MAIARLLPVLGVPRRAPSLAYLRELTEAHLDAVPYENVSKLLRLASGKRDLPSEEEYVEGIEAFGFGGTCYAVNFYFSRLLAELGFDVSLAGGLSNDGLRDHLCLRVAADGGLHVVDLGFLSPDPGPFDLAGPLREMWSGRQLFRFVPAGDGLNFRFQVTKEGNLGREFVSRPEPYDLAQFAAPIAGSFGDDRMFMKLLCISKRYGDHFKTVWDREAAVVRGAETTRRPIDGIEQLEQYVHGEMGLSRYPLRAALAMLKPR